jgi:hypothetical protein
MHWPHRAASGTADRQETKALERYLRLRGASVSPIWAGTVADARRWAAAAERLERTLQAMR